MPHLVVLYTANLDQEADISRLARRLADTMLAVRDESGKQVFPIGGTRVLCYPAAHSAVADGRGDYAFMYLNLRMARDVRPILRPRMLRPSASSSFTHSRWML